MIHHRNGIILYHCTVEYFPTLLDTQWLVISTQWLCVCALLSVLQVSIYPSVCVSTDPIVAGKPPIHMIRKKKSGTYVFFLAQG